MKLIKIFGILLLTLFTMAGTALAADYTISSLWVNGDAVAGSLHVEPGQKLVVQAHVKGLSGEAKDVQMKAWIGGYEYNLIQAETSMFRVRSGVTYSKTLTLELPNDLDTGSNDYKLHVELYDAVDVVSKTFNLFVEEPRHNLQIQDVILVPGSNVNAGDVLYVKVRVENMGYKKEEDIRVEVSIPELSVMAKTYIDELSPRNDDENSQSSNTLYLRVPEDAKSGSYEMNVKLVYDKGYTTLQETRLVYVDGVSDANSEANALVSVETGKTELTVGQEETYQVLVANMGKTTSVYTVQVIGAGWADVKAEPTMMSVTKSSTGEFLLNVTPKLEGEHQFTVRVMEGDAVALEKNISVSVQKASKSGNLKAFWLVGILVLVVIVALVIVSQVQGDKVTDNDYDNGYYQEQKF